MTAAGSRFERQMRLPEIGVLGQARIENGQLRLGQHLDDFGRQVALAYARGAGVAREAEDAASPVPEALSVFRHPASRSVAAGAIAALTAMVEALES